MDLSPHLASLRAAAGLARLAILDVRAEGFAVVRHTRRGPVRAEVTLGLDTPRRTLALRLRTDEDPGIGGLVLRLTREGTPRGEGRKYREQHIGTSPIDEDWVIEGDAADAIRAAGDALSQLSRYDAELSFDRGAMNARVRTSEGRRPVELETAADALGALIAVWRAFGAPDDAPPPPTAGDERERQAALDAIRDDVAAATALLGGEPHRVGDAWQARVALPLAGVELEGSVRAVPTKGDLVIVELEGAVAPDAAPTRVTKERPLIGNPEVIVDADEPLASSVAVAALAASARTLDAVVAPAPADTQGRISVRAEVERADVRPSIDAALALWRAAHRRD